MPVWVSLRGMLRLIRIDTLRRVQNISFLAAQINISWEKLHVGFCFISLRSLLEISAQCIDYNK